MKISGGKKLFTLYKKDLTILKFETLLILGSIIVFNLFLYYKAKTSWPLDMSLGLSTLLLSFVPLFTFFRAFNFIKEEWKENTVYFMMSLPTSGNIIFLSKFLALLTQFFILMWQGDGGTATWQNRNVTTRPSPCYWYIHVEHLRDFML